MNADHRVDITLVEIESPRPHRIALAARHAMDPFDHVRVLGKVLGRRDPYRPFLFAPDLGRAIPGPTVLSHPDPITDRLAAALHMKQVPAVGVDDKRSRRLRCFKIYDLP